jgi:molecular chaperone GrpE
MEDVKTDAKPADETVYTEDAVSDEEKIEDAEVCGDDGTRENVPEEETAKEESGKKGLFGKKKEKQDPRDEKIKELTDRLYRSMAEFDNYRKRTEKEKSTMFEIGAKDIVERILPVVDNFERGLAAISDEGRNAPFADGMEKIYKQLMKTLEEAGVEPIEALGKPFDPDFHHAVMHIEDESLGENVISRELQKGYTYRGTVVKHSMVQVAN